MTENTELTIKAEQALAQLNPADLLPAGMDNLAPEDTGMPPRLRISQRNRPISVGDEDAPAGSIVNTLSGEVMTSVEFVPVVFLPRTRVLWPENFSAENDPECLSDDGAQPIASNGRTVTNPRTGPCESCELAQFVDGVPPRCKMQRNFLVLLVESQEPAILTMQSTAIKAARHLTTLARTQGLRKSIVMTTREERSDKGQWHVPAFVAGGKLNPQLILSIVEKRNELQNLVITADVEQSDIEQVTIDPQPQVQEEIPF